MLEMLRKPVMLALGFTHLIAVIHTVIWLMICCPEDTWKLFRGLVGFKPYLVGPFPCWICVYGLKLVVGASTQTKTIGTDSIGSQSVLYLLCTLQKIVLLRMPLVNLKLRIYLNLNPITLLWFKCIFFFQRFICWRLDL